MVNNMEKWKAEKLARALVEVGVNIQEGETLLLLSDIEARDLAREVVAAAFARGAADAEIMWTDQISEHLRALYGTPDRLKVMPEWKKEGMDSLLGTGSTVRMSIFGSYPTLNRDVPDENLMALSEAGNDLQNVARKYVHRAVLKWTGTVFPTMDWARSVFPEYDDGEAYARLEDAICRMMHIDEFSDPVKNWKDHCRELADRSAKLNSYDFSKLHLMSELGTDLWIGLVEGHIWLSAGEMGAENVNAPYVANMPTEEVFTAPDFRSVEGIAYASFPLFINGKLVRDFSITFRNGRAVDCSASEGLDFLKAALFRDENTRRLGEVALVSKRSPIRQMGRIFYNGMIDENAACHLAFGTSFPDCVKGGTLMSEEELFDIGVNHAVSHNDFMVGTDDMTVIGITHGGTEVTVMEHGDFVL